MTKAVSHTASAPEKTSLRIWFIWGVGALFYFYQFILRTSPSVMPTQLMEAFSVQAATLGLLTASYYHAYSLLQVPMGTLLDRLGPRRLLTISAACCAVGCFLFASAQDMTLAYVGRLLIGAGSASAFIGTVTVGRIWLPARWMGLVIGVTMVFGTVGGITGQAPTHFLMQYMGWRSAILVAGGLGLVLTVLIWLVVRDRPRKDLLQDGEAHPTFLEGFLKVIATPQAWLIAFFGCCMYVPLPTFVELWGPMFIEELFKTDRSVASWVITMITLGIGIGSPFTTFFSDYIRKRKPLMYLGVILSFIAYGIALYMPGLNIYTMAAVLFVCGVAFTGELLCFAAICDIMPLKYTGVALGFLNMTIMASGVIFQPLVSKLLDWNFSGICVEGRPLYTIENFRFALMPIPLMLLVGFVLLLFIKETCKKHPKNN